MNKERKHIGLYLHNVGVFTEADCNMKWRRSVFVDDIDLRSALEEHLRIDSFRRQGNKVNAQLTSTTSASS